MRTPDLTRSRLGSLMKRLRFSAARRSAINIWSDRADLPPLHRHHTLHELLSRLLVPAALIISTLIGPHTATAGTIPRVSMVTINQAMSPSPMVLDERTGHLFVATSPDTSAGLPVSWVTMIDVHSAKVLRHTAVGLGLPRLAFDPQLDRIYVAGVDALTVPGRSPHSATPPRIAAALVVMLDGMTGGIVGTAQLDSQGNAIAVDPGLDHLFVASGGGSSCADNRCYTDPSVVTMLDARTLKVLAVTSVGNTPQADLLVDDRNNRLYESAGDGIDVLDARTAKRVLHIPLAGTVLAVDAAANRVLLADRTNDLLLLDGRTSVTLAVLPISPTFSFGFPNAAFVVDQGTDHLYYAAAQGRAQNGAPSGAVRLYEADGVTGRVVHSCPIAAHPTAVATTPQPGVVIVTDSGTTSADVLRMVDCRIVWRIRVPHTPINIAVDETNNRLVVASNTPARLLSASNTTSPSTNTVLTIATLP